MEAPDQGREDTGSRRGAALGGGTNGDSRRGSPRARHDVPSAPIAQIQPRGSRSVQGDEDRPMGGRMTRSRASRPTRRLWSLDARRLEAQDPASREVDPAADAMVATDTEGGWA